jgi:S1-C subfamily serine protease
VAVTEAGKVVPVTEVLACNKSTDACIVRVQSATPLEPLPLNADIAPGDEVWCYSDPAGHAGFFSQGIVNRFYQDWDFTEAKPKSPKRMNVSTDWASGSSGAAVLDRFGNAVGHVCMISAQGADHSSEATAGTNRTAQTVIVFHDAVCASDVIALVKR